MNLAIKLQIIRDLLQAKELESLVDGVDKKELLDIKEFIFGKVLEFGFKTKGRKFSRDKVLNALSELKNFQANKNCRMSAATCRNLDCFDQNPECAREKIKLEIAMLSRFFRDHINHTKT